jgi:hypothetical protein
MTRKTATRQERRYPEGEQLCFWNPRFQQWLTLGQIAYLKSQLESQVVSQ